VRSKSPTSGIAKARDMLAAPTTILRTASSKGNTPTWPRAGTRQRRRAQRSLLARNFALRNGHRVNPFRASTTFENAEAGPAAEFPPLELHSLGHGEAARFAPRQGARSSRRQPLLGRRSHVRELARAPTHRADRVGAKRPRHLMRRFRGSTRPPTLRPDAVAAGEMVPPPDATPIEVPLAQPSSPPSPMAIGRAFR